MLWDVDLVLRLRLPDSESDLSFILMGRVTLDPAETAETDTHENTKKVPELFILTTLSDTFWASLLLFSALVNAALTSVSFTAI